MRIAILVLLLGLSGCTTVNMNACPMGDQSTSCKCWRGEIPRSECRNWEGIGHGRM